MGKVNGWIKLHRAMLKWEWYDDSATLHVFLTVLLNANHEPKEWKGVMVGKGQWVTGRKKLAKITGLSERQVRTALARLQTTSTLTIKTTNKYSLITVVKWDTYQIKEKETTSNLTSQTPVNDHKQEVKEVINYLNVITGKKFSDKSKGNVESISGRLNDGYSVADCKLVIDKKWQEWRGGDMEQYVRPSTLFGVKKFDAYLNQSTKKTKKDQINNVHGMPFTGGIDL